ncbi:MAG: hypothetical protein JST14_12110 [Bacteroidetes bacterium]|nr:hypothetical protein [Bacteroidota bacterium]
MFRGILLVLVLFALLSACTQRLICPAYQSSFIYDQETLRKKFSYFREDSTPKVLTASKNRYLIAVPESYRKKYRRLQTVEMKPVYPVIPDSLKEDKGAALVGAEEDISDSTAAKKVDSIYAITKTKEKYNLDQDLYMWYFRDILVLPDVRAALEKKEADKNKPKEEEVKAQPKKKGLFGRKQASDSTQVNELKEQPKKKGLFGKKKSDDSKPKSEENKVQKKENDGF